MQNNYDRLFQELTDLIGEKEVHQHLDQELKTRIDNLYRNKGAANPIKTANQLACLDSQSLFQAVQLKNRTNSDLNPLRDSTNLSKPTRKTTLNSTGPITSKKYDPAIQYSDKTMGKMSVNSSKAKLLPAKSTRTSSKNLIRYNTQIAEKSKSKEKSKTKNMADPRSRLKTMKSSLSNEKMYKKVSGCEKDEKENTKGFVGQKSSKEIFKKQKVVSEFLTFNEPKFKEKTSKLQDSREILKRLATLQTQPSRMSTHSNLVEKPGEQKLIDKKSIEKKSTEKRSISKKSMERKTSSRQQDYNVVEVIQKKQESLNEERYDLEQEMQYWKDLIENERNSLSAINYNISRLHSEISRRASLQKGSTSEVKVSRKKSENFFSEVRQIEHSIVNYHKSKDKVASNIEEQKYLITMYNRVIDQMRTQLKIEQYEKTELRKRLSSLKNSQKAAMERYTSREALSDQMFKTMHQSLKKWV